MILCYNEHISGDSSWRTKREQTGDPGSIYGDIVGERAPMYTCASIEFQANRYQYNYLYSRNAR